MRHVDEIVNKIVERRMRDVAMVRRSA